AELCAFYKKQYAAAARLWAAALAADPKLADDLKAAHRYNAACAAALAAAGKGEDAGGLGADEQARWRKQATEWLRADRGLWGKRLEGGKPEDRKAVADKMKQWQRDGDLESLRSPTALEKLPADEREVCRRLWADVAALLGKAQDGK